MKKSSLSDAAPAILAKHAKEVQEAEAKGRMLGDNFRYVYVHLPYKPEPVKIPYKLKVAIEAYVKCLDYKEAADFACYSGTTQFTKSLDASEDAQDYLADRLRLRFDAAGLNNDTVLMGLQEAANLAMRLGKPSDATAAWKEIARLRNMYPEKIRANEAAPQTSGMFSGMVSGDLKLVETEADERAS